MARARITYVFDPATGQRDLRIEYESGDDALADEHEQEHRRLVRGLLGDLYPTGAFPAGASSSGVQVEREAAPERSEPGDPEPARRPALLVQGPKTE